MPRPATLALPLLLLLLSSSCAPVPPDGYPVEYLGEVAYVLTWEDGAIDSWTYLTYVDIFTVDPGERRYRVRMEGDRTLGSACDFVVEATQADANGAVDLGMAGPARCTWTTTARDEVELEFNRYPFRWYPTRFQMTLNGTLTSTSPSGSTRAGELTVVLVAE